MLPLHDRLNAHDSVINLLRSLNVDINTSEVLDELEKHPSDPSLLAISDVFNWFGIENGSYRVSADELSEVSVPFIAQMKRSKGFITVHKITDTEVVVSDDKKRRYKQSINEFKRYYDGVLLYAEPAGSASGPKPGLLDKLAVYKPVAAITTLVLVIITSVILYTDYVSTFNWQIGLVSLFKLAGLGTSILLLMQSIDKNDPLIRSFCGSDAKSNCNAILTSKAATVFKGLTWSEVGFFYFAGTLIALLTSSHSVASMQLLAILNILSLPYTIYSITYQARVAKQWCVFCITVQCLLWLEFLPLVTYLRSPLVFSIPAMQTLAICLLVPVASWMLLKPMLLKGQQLKTLKKQLKTFKYNKALFERSLREQPKFAMPDEDWSIVLGNVEADNIITVVSNPYCTPCSQVHAELDEWLNKFDDIQLRIIFTAKNHQNDKQTPITRHLMALRDQKSAAEMKEALHYWYTMPDKDLDTFAKIYPVTLDEKRFNVLEKQDHWCEVVDVNTTPTLLINGHRLPSVYRLQDIKYLLR